MKRRDVLKGLGLSAGALVLTPTVVSLLQSCAKEEAITWTPSFFTKEQIPLLNNIVDIILPKTEDSPSATEVNVPQFIDKYIQEVFEPEEQEISRNGFKNFSKLFLQEGAETENFSHVKEKDVEPIISKILTKTKLEHETIMKNFNEAIENETVIADDTLHYVTLDGIRGLSIFGYKNSQEIGENVLVYAPIPGKQEGCIDVSETGGKAYSL